MPQVSSFSWIFSLFLLLFLFLNFLFTFSSGPFCVSLMSFSHSFSIFNFKFLV